MSKIKNRGIISKMAEISELPLDIARGSPLFQLYSDRELLIECVKNIEYYDERRIKIRTCNMFVTIGGNSLNIRFLEPTRLYNENNEYGAHLIDTSANEGQVRF